MSQYAYDYNPAKTQDFRVNGIEIDKFNQWTRDNLYRTSYGNHWTQLPQEPKNVVYPGYEGFIPGLKSSNQYGKTYSQIARDSFSNPKLGQNTFKLSSTGFNFRKHDFIDQSLDAQNHKYGRQTIQKHHPSQNAEFWLSQTQTSFRDPKQLPNPTFRETNKFLQTQKPKTVESGFSQNFQTCDGKGWIPERILNANRQWTEYRVRFNEKIPFHRDTTLFKVRKMKQKEYVYKYVG
eukprot:TRINITY_DN1024_c0_g1_i4.p1 TRINITY_DN1024_c0_g1~~TRINITY_DN1024_c0_g1_i4.p1  ORF type:complete len:235 (+),score=36.60 TRINITY_DN1024_c0_g1_i4:290-994(+)